MVYKERPKDGASYGWCKKCDGFVIELGRHCYNDDSHIVDHLSPQEREELKEDEILESDWRPDPSKKKPPEPIPKPETKIEETESKPMPKTLTLEQKSEAKNNGEKIKAYRKHCNFSYADLANVVGVSFGCIRNWEKGSSYPLASNQITSKGDAYQKLMGAIADFEENPEHDWKAFWNYQDPEKEVKPRVRLKEPKIEPPVSNQLDKKSSVEDMITAFVRGIVREEIQKAFRDLAERSS